MNMAFIQISQTRTIPDLFFEAKLIAQPWVAAGDIKQLPPLNVYMNRDNNNGNVTLTFPGYVQTAAALVPASVISFQDIPAAFRPMIPEFVHATPVVDDVNVQFGTCTITSAGVCTIAPLSPSTFPGDGLEQGYKGFALTYKGVPI